MGVRRLCAAAVTVFAMSMMGIPSASAATAPDLTCGSPADPGPCQQTEHFSDINELDTPAPPGGGCPAALSNDFVTFVGTGHGIEHLNVNKAQDGWFTMTFTGTVTVTLYLNGTVNGNGDVTSVSNPDPNAGPYTGKMTEWFGGSFNNQSSVFHGTNNLSLVDASGASFSLHFVTHASWTPGTDPDGPPHTAFDKLRCT